MPKVICEKYSNYRDLLTKVQFNSVLDHRSGCFVGLAEVDDETAAKFDGREGFEVLSEAEFAALSTAPPKSAEGEEQVAADAPASDGLDALSYNEVMALAKELKLDLRGKKDAIIARIRDARVLGERVQELVNSNGGTNESDGEVNAPKNGLDGSNHQGQE